jgi:lipopolysaccharide transport system ATP-binding protein
VGSLLEVGTGFHPELTGRENIYLNGSILGMSRREIARKFDEIVDFAEVERFLDTPVKRYSSGMYVRLAFSVAAHLEPEILIVDEVLAVGDSKFQKKCLTQMGNIAKGGRTILFVSHNLQAIETLCTKAVYLAAGNVCDAGSTQHVVASHARDSLELTATSLLSRTDRVGCGTYQFGDIRFLDKDGLEISHGASGQQITIRLSLIGPNRYQMQRPLDIGIAVKDRGGNTLVTFATFFVGSSPILNGQSTVECRLASLPLLAGTYTLDLWCGFNNDTVDLIHDAAVLDVCGGDFYRNAHDSRRASKEKHGPFACDHSWVARDID